MATDLTDESPFPSADEIEASCQRLQERCEGKRYFYGNDAGTLVSMAQDYTIAWAAAKRYAKILRVISGTENRD